MQYEKLQREVMILHYMEGAEAAVRLHEVVHDSESAAYALVMERIPGEPLNTTSMPSLDSIQNVMRQVRTAGSPAGGRTFGWGVGHQPSHVPRRALAQVLEVLEFAHARGIMHRDVKKGNLLVNEESGRVWLIDW